MLETKFRFAGRTCVIFFFGGGGGEARLISSFIFGGNSILFSIVMAQAYAPTSNL